LIVLDTNVVSELMRAEPAPAVMDWVNAQPSDQLWLCSVVVAELLYGVGRLPEGARKRQLASAVEAMVFEDFAGRTLPFDLEAAAAYAQLVTQRESAGEPIAMADAQIGAICAVHGATLATGNARDFAKLGLKLINPWL
jgi:predicted nucleic acid-binding protein